MQVQFTPCTHPFLSVGKNFFTFKTSWCVAFILFSVASLKLSQLVMYIYHLGLGNFFYYQATGHNRIGTTLFLDSPFPSQVLIGNVLELFVPEYIETFFLAVRLSM